MPSRPLVSDFQVWLCSALVGIGGTCSGILVLLSASLLL